MGYGLRNYPTLTDAYVTYNNSAGTRVSALLAFVIAFFLIEGLFLFRCCPFVSDLVLFPFCVELGKGVSVHDALVPFLKQSEQL